MGFLKWFGVGERWIEAGQEVRSEKGHSIWRGRVWGQCVECSSSIRRLPEKVRVCRVSKTGHIYNGGRDRRMVCGHTKEEVGTLKEFLWDLSRDICTERKWTDHGEAVCCGYHIKNRQYSNGLIEWQPSSTEQFRSHEGTQQGDATSGRMLLTQSAGQSLAVIAETHLEDSGNRTQEAW